jgi:DNA-binding CsgD family transcriptional regulator
MHSDDATLLEALDAGASALVRKSSGAEEIVSAVLRAAETPLSFSAAGLADALRRRSEPKQTPLTARESEVLELLAEGASVAQVGKRLYMSESTVKTHIAKIYDKLGVHNRAGAIMTAVRLGLVGGSGDPPGPALRAEPRIAPRWPSFGRDPRRRKRLRRQPVREARNSRAPPPRMAMSTTTTTMTKATVRPYSTAVACEEPGVRTRARIRLFDMATPSSPVPRAP